MISINNLSQFKKALQIGIKLETTHHTGKFVGRDENGVAQYQPLKFPTREVSIVQSNSFALKTTKKDGKIVDSWCQYPKSKDLECNGSNEVTIFWGEGEKREPVLTYKFI